MIRNATVPALGLAMLTLAGCAPLGEWTGRHVPRQPEIAGAATATLTPLSATLSGTNEVPMNFSYGRGQASASYDQTSGMLSWNVTYNNLTGEITGAHFHGPAAEGENAGVQVNIGANGLASPMQGSAPITPEQASHLLGALWYVNIHSTTYPDGELRGQVRPGGAM